MPRIVAINTTTQFGSLVLIEDGRVLDESPMQSTDGFSHILFDCLADLLARRFVPR